MAFNRSELAILERVPRQHVVEGSVPGLEMNGRPLSESVLEARNGRLGRPADSAGNLPKVG